MRHSNLFLLFFLFPLIAIGQKEDLAAHMAFFQAKAQRYQRWLDTTGLGQVLQVEKVSFAFDPETRAMDTHELELYLSLRDTNPSRAWKIWELAERNFEAQSDRPLKAALFSTFTHNMEIPPVQGNVQIYIEDQKGNKYPGYFIWIWQEENGTLRDSMQYGSKSQHFEISVPALVLKKTGRSTTTQRTYIRPPEEVFNIIMALARELYPYNKYVNTECAGRSPVVIEESRTTHQLVFSVSDLCREALTNSELSVWCKIARATGWQSDCNDIKRERLTFTFDYIPNGQEGYRLKCHLVGKFGSGVYMPRTSGYMDMDPDFLSFEKDYALKFQQILKSRL